MAIQQLSKAEIEAVSGGAVITIDTGALPDVGGLLGGLVGTVTGVLGSVLGLVNVGSLLGTVTGLLNNVLGAVGLPSISLSASVDLNIG